MSKCCTPSLGHSGVTLDTPDPAAYAVPFPPVVWACEEIVHNKNGDWLVDRLMDWLSDWLIDIFIDHMTK